MNRTLTLGSGIHLETKNRRFEAVSTAIVTNGRTGAESTITFFRRTNEILVESSVFGF